MCGIAGWVDWRRDLTHEMPTVEVMGSTLACRGPDERGNWISPHAAFSHRRLVVVDPAGGHQPMVRSRGPYRFVLVYNGELYNTEELRHELFARGHRFEGRSDTEVLLLAYVEWGPRCVERFNGIFAFGIWDEEKQWLFAARDRLGVKPFFYAERDGGLLFGSELKALLAHPLVPPEVDAEGLAEVFVMGPARTPGHGVFRGVRELEPGWWMIFERDPSAGTPPRGRIRMSRYWSLESRPHEDDLPTTAERVRSLVEDSVSRQLVADVPVCTLLSGGIDSSAVTAFAQAEFRRRGMPPIRTYSIDYRGNEQHFRPSEFQPHSDGPWVHRVSEFLGTDHRRVVIDTPELAEALRWAVRARDLPGMADVDSSLLLFSRAIKQESTVALSGECADEVFGGYPWFWREEDLRADTFPWARWLAGRVRLFSRDLVATVQPEQYLRRRYHEALDEVPRLEGESPEEARLREIAYLSLTRFMPTLLDRKDRMSMAVGLEVRVPYCDHRLVEYVWNIPWRMKMHEGREKGILRLALKGVLPDDVVARRKSPYPKTYDPAYLEAVRDWVLGLLDDPSSPLRPFVDRELVRRFAVEEAGSVHLPWFGQLMSGPQLLAYLAQVDTWLRDYHVRVRA
ncbi:asparagine synthase (glutamine-hydrolyzing) [Carboxydochorda subterranea]|uniref:asparagine synthase (glutamine-hydrolyzing) n=1 Tax=Carboxydichorda subterranea TaxID=3109565 RepID=A0ABZ1BUX7_9FIRM|nr:asparagine synthase (glutamine-hydrolyzing) [Limnochorda sp. L945t]WRP16617.1 asparagine synthase (glutamine-hydrolyzing) [Limnochorda sp. L945t]